MATLTYNGGPAHGTQHTVPGKPPNTRYYAPPGDRAQAGQWLQLGRYSLKWKQADGTYTYTFSGYSDVLGPKPAVGANGGEPIEGWS